MADLTEAERAAIDGPGDPARRLSGLEPGGYCRPTPERDTMASKDERTAMSDFEIKVGGEPPESARHGNGKYSAIAKAAMEHAGEWISVPGVNRNLAGAIRSGNVVGFKPSKDWDVRNADTDKDSNKATLWVKYLGKDEETDVRSQ